MTSDELRALADALEPMAKAPRFEDFDVPAFCAWVRAQADAQPVAWIARNLTTGRVKWTTDRCRARGWTRDANLRVKLLYAHPAPAVPAGWQLVPVEPTPEMLSAVGMMDGYDWHAPGCSPDADHANWYSAMIAAAPAAPQAESMADSDADYWLRNRQAILDAIERAGFMLMSNASGFWLHPRGTTDAQAEPLSDERIAEIQRAAYERAAQECIETAAELRRCADGCTDGRYDWKADGADDCADAIRALGGNDGN